MLLEAGVATSCDDNAVNSSSFGDESCGVNESASETEVQRVESASSELISFLVSVSV